MKKSKIYFIAPLIAIAIFYAYYWNFSSDYDAKQAVIAAQVKAAKNEKLKQEAQLREKAIEDALESQKARKAERIARDAKERQQKDDMENATLTRDKAYQEAEKLQRQVEKLTLEVKTAKDEIAKIEADEKKAVEEEGFLKTYVTKADENKDRLMAVLTKIEAADAAATKAAQMAAAAAAKNR